jgi:probable HAF family extracellular repeat protein
MLKKVLPLLGGAGLVCVLFVSSHSTACGPGGSVTITNIPTLGGGSFNMLAMSSTGDVGGFSSLPGELQTHPLVFSGGVSHDLGTLGGTFGETLALNDAGQAVGFANVAGDLETHAFLYSGGTMHDLGGFGGTSGAATAINHNGQVAGSANLAGDATQHAFLYSGGVMTDLGSLGGDYSSGTAINSSGVVIGDSLDSVFNFFGYVYSNGTMTSVGDLGGGVYSSALAINDAGVVVGESTVASGDIHAFLYSAGAIHDLGTLGGTFSTANAVNAAGQVIGTSANTNHQNRGFRYSGGVMTDLGELGGGTSMAQAINTAGQVVGASRVLGGEFHAFLWQNGTMIDLNSLLPTNSAWVLQTAQFVNDAVRIVGVGTLNGVSQWYVLDLPAGGNNTAPVAVISPLSQTVDCQTSAVLSGTGSSDPDGDAISFEWSENGTVLGTNSSLTISFDLGDHTVTLKVTDACGASGQTNAVVHVADSTAPTIVSVPPGGNVSADGTGVGKVPNITAGVVATDNCTAANALVVTQDPQAGTLLGLGSHIIFITVADATGNKAKTNTTFSVMDTTPPVIVSGPGPITVPAGDQCLGAVPNVAGQIVATDNSTPAGSLIITQNPVAGTLLGAGPHPITVTVTDGAGNSTQGFTAFSVVDNQPPVISFVPVCLFALANGNGVAPVPNVLNDVVALDKCTPSAMLMKSQSPAAGTLLAPGKYDITVSVTDAAGNTATRTVKFHVLDLTPPVFQSVTVSVDGPVPKGSKPFVPVTVHVTATDNVDTNPVSKICFITSAEPVLSGEVVLTGSLTANLAPSHKSASRTRTYTITVKCTDNSGNSAFTNVDVTIPAAAPGQQSSTVDVSQIIGGIRSPKH